ncbi:MAG: NUDIX domain-containing protein [Bacteroidota bacterium]
MHNTITKHRPTCQRHKDAYRLRKYAQGAADAASIDLWALARLRDSSALPLIAQLQRTKMLSPNILLKARALISDGRQLLLCWDKGHQFFLLPGGTLEPGEALKDCLGRELREELGRDFTIRPLLGCPEWHWQEGVQADQQLDFAFKVPVPARLLDGTLTAQEAHLRCQTVLLDELAYLPNVAPPGIAALVAQHSHQEGAYAFVSSKCT